ncbi:hypothetical protein GYB22_12805 [bacterium]|nr:hypothetical protein [bacterium]
MSIQKLFPLLLIVFVLNACKKEEDEPEETVNTVPEFYSPAIAAEYGKTPPSITTHANIFNTISTPQDLEFHPTETNELWVINKDIENTGGSTVTIYNPGKQNQTSSWRRDGNAWHFMSLPSSMAFSNNGNWASAHNVQDANHQGGTFTGPTLWSSHPQVYAQPSGGNGSHLDMVHSTPFGMGIASEEEHIFWVNDGYHEHLVRYDFVDDHGPGNDYHGDARVHRYTEIELIREPEIPGHMVLDANKKWLYIADPHNSRVIRVNIQSGTKLQDLPLINEPLAQHWEITGVEWEIFTEVNLDKPSGIAIRDNRLFVSDYNTGEIVAYNVETREELARIDTGDEGICGITLSPSGKLWFVNAKESKVNRVDPR